MRSNGRLENLKQVWPLLLLWHQCHATFRANHGWRANDFLSVSPLGCVHRGDTLDCGAIPARSGESSVYVHVVYVLTCLVHIAWGEIGFRNVCATGNHVSPRALKLRERGTRAPSLIFLALSVSQAIWKTWERGLNYCANLAKLTQHSFCSQ